MAHLEEVEGIVLSTRKHRERDFLVKIFTKEYGQLMFFVRGTKKANNKLLQAIQPFTSGTYIADIRKDGLCFLRETKDIFSPTHVQMDIFNNAYATYTCGLINAALDDRQPDLYLFQQLKIAISLMNEEVDSEIIMNIFEIRLLNYFGVMPEFRGCVICAQTEGTFDYSSKYHGLLCPKHFFEDERRLHASPRAIHLIRLFSTVSLEKLGTVNVKTETKKEIRKIIDQLYDELVGLQLKSKKFIDTMHDWEGMLKNRE